MLLRQGLDLVMDWPDGASCRLSAWRDGRDGVRGELTATYAGARCSWGTWSLASTVARDSLAKRLKAHAPEVAWSAHLEEAAFRFTEAARTGEPLVTLTGTAATEPALLLPGWLYAGEPTLLYADGDTGKSLTALTLAVAMAAGVTLPGGLMPLQATPAAYLDWETTAPTMERRLALVAGGLGVPPPPILYKRMTRPLVDEVGRLSREFAVRRVGFVVIDSKMFAVASGEGTPFHEPITAFYGALRLFAPAAVLVLNHVTNADARAGTPARPFGGAFAFNGPRLIWEAKRDPEVEDATAIVFTCRKANNLDRKPPPFGLRFTSHPIRGLEVTALDLGTVSQSTLAGATLSTRVLTMLSEPLSVEALVEALHAKPDSIARTLRRLKDNRQVAQLQDGRWIDLAALSGPVSGRGGSRLTGAAALQASGPPLHPPKDNTNTRSKKDTKTENAKNSANARFDSVDNPDNSGHLVRGSLTTPRHDSAFASPDMSGQSGQVCPETAFEETAAWNGGDTLAPVGREPGDESEGDDAPF